MKRKWLLTMIAPMLALTLVTGCGTNDQNEPVDERPLDQQDIDDRDLDNNEMDRNIEDENLRDRDDLDQELNNDRTNENDLEDTR